MVRSITIETHKRTEMIDITMDVQKVISKSEKKEGLCCVFVPHTTAGITINENDDPSVKEDILKELNKVIPFDDGYVHMEGNSAGHIKSTLMGSSVMIMIEEGRLKLGTWQGVYFCEFDGPRTRNVWIKIL